MGLKRWAIIVSVILHTLLIVGLWLPQPSQNEWLKRETELQIVWKNQQPRSMKGQQKKNSQKQKKVSSKKSKKPINLQALRPKVIVPPHNGNWGREPTVGYGDSETGDPFLDTMNGMGLMEYSSNRPFFEELKDRIDRNTPFPDELAKHGWKGRVWVKVIVDKRGRLIKVVDTSKNNPELVTYTLIGVYRALAKNLPDKSWHQKREHIPMHLVFDYRINTLGNMQAYQHAAYFKNRMTFHRMQTAPNLLEEAIEKYSRYIPPVIPVPGGFVVDFIQVYRMIKSWQELDPLIKEQQQRAQALQRLNNQIRRWEQLYLMEPVTDMYTTD